MITFTVFCKRVPWGLSKGKKIIFPAFCTLKGVLHPSWTREAWNASKTWGGTDMEAWGRRKDLAQVRACVWKKADLPLALWKKKAFLSKGFKQTKGHWLFLVWKASEGDTLPCKGMTGRKKGIRRFVFQTYLICVTWQIHDLPIQRTLLL